MPFHKLFSWKDVSEYRVSAWVLVAANCIPLLGVLFWGWSTFVIVIVYWAENVVLGAINLLKMLLCKPSQENSILSKISMADPIQQQTLKKISQIGNSLLLVHAPKLFFLPFFTVHYGIFCLVHGVFVFALLGDAHNMGSGSPFDIGENFSTHLWQDGLIWALLGLTASHIVSFVANYLIRGEYRQSTLQKLMLQPYGRIVTLHLAILLGAFATFAFGSPVWILVILIVGKTVLDLKLHLYERYKNLLQQRPEENNHKQRGNEGFHAGAK